MENATPLKNLSPEQRATVELGEPLVCFDPNTAAGEPKRIQGFVLLPAKAEVVWDFCCDWSNMNRLVPSIRYQVLEQTRVGAVEELALTSEVKAGLVRMHFVSMARSDHDARMQTWRLASAEEIAGLRARGVTVADNSSFVRAVYGRSQFIDYGTRCLLVYQSDFVPAARLPRLIQDFLTRRGLATYLHAFAKWFGAKAEHDAVSDPGALHA